MRRAVRVFAQVRFRFWIRAAMLNTRFRSTKRSESCDAVIRVYDAAGNVIETHEHAGEFKAWLSFTRVTSHFPLRRVSHDSVFVG